MKVMVSISDETRTTLNNLADEDGIEPGKRVHQWLRHFAFDPPQGIPGGASWASQASALINRGELRVGTQTFTKEELLSAKKRFALPNGADDAKPGENEVEVIFAGRLADILPLCLAYLDLGSTAEGRRIRGWNGTVGFMEFLTAGKAAEEQAKSDARSVEEEETAIYPSTKKAKKEKKSE